MSSSFCYSLAWSPDGQQLASSSDSAIRLWSPITGKLLHTLVGHTEEVISIAWSPDGQQLASGSADTTVQVWDATTGKLQHTLVGHTSRIQSVIWSPDGQRLASSSSIHSYPYPDYVTVYIWRSDTWEPIAMLDNLRGSASIVWHPYLPLVITTGKQAEDLFVWHLELKQLHQTAPPSQVRQRDFICSTCGEAFTKMQVNTRLACGFMSIRCSACDTEVSLLDRVNRLTSPPPSLITATKQESNNQRNGESTMLILPSKIVMQNFDVFLCHHGVDKLAVKQIGKQLKLYGLLPWLDEWELRPGLPWQQVLEEQISHIKTVAVFVGKNGLGPWQYQELAVFLHEFAARGRPVIPVLLPDAPQEPTLPMFLKAMTWVDFRVQDPDPLQQLYWGITGRRAAGERM